VLSPIFIDAAVAMFLLRVIVARHADDCFAADDARQRMLLLFIAACHADAVICMLMSRHTIHALSYARRGARDGDSV